MSIDSAPPVNESDSPDRPPSDKSERGALPIVSPFERVFDGPLTQEMLLEPAKFGLGLLPERKQPDATTNMVCGFCSTGCSLNIHLQDGQAINLSPAVDYPVNTGMACPKGWEALAPLKADDRGTTPLLKQPSGKLAPVDWHTAMTEFTGRFKAIQEKHGKESVAFLGTGQMPTEELAFLGAEWASSMVMETLGSAWRRQWLLINSRLDSMLHRIRTTTLNNRM